MKKNVMRKNLQLVGVTAMLIASKYEEVNDTDNESDSNTYLFFD